jgi:surfeit locus 1 family protein
MVRLGVWQLDRLEQRQAFNARVQAQLDAEALDLNRPQAAAQDLGAMEYRAVRVRGRYDHTQEVALRNQAWGNQPGLHLVTPLVLEGTGLAVMVDRGWIPVEAHTAGELEDFAEPGLVEITGVIRRSQTRPDFGRRDDPLLPGGEPLRVWNLMNLERMDAQVSHQLLPVYIQQAPDPAWTALPYRIQPELDLTEGPHLGYAGQWFLFAAVLAIGYPLYLRRNHALETDLEPEQDPEPAAIAVLNDTPNWSLDP